MADQSSTTVIGEQDALLSYHDGKLSWKAGAVSDEDVVTVTKDGDGAYMLWSLASIREKDEKAPDQRPFDLQLISAKSLPEEYLEKHLFQSLPPQLDPKANELYVLISTVSGTGLAADFFDQILRPVLGAIGLIDSEYTVIKTRTVESMLVFAKSNLLERANKGQNQTILVLSGDGGIVDIINGLLGGDDLSSSYVKPVISQLPLGSGNALFHSLHKSSALPSPYIQGFRTLLHGTPKPLPMFRADFSPGARLITDEGQTTSPLAHDTLYGVVVASYGLHSTLVADSDTTEYRKHGEERFGLVAKDLLYPSGGLPHAYQAEVTLFKSGGESKIPRDEHGYILAALVSNLQSTFRISPESKPLDGQLRVVHFASLSGDEAMGIMTEAYNDGNHVKLEAVGYESIDGLKIQFREEAEDWKWRRCCIDGLIVGVEKGGWMEVRTLKPGEEAVDVVFD